MGLIIEVTGDTRTTRLENFSSVASGLLSIGRARDNDLILDDPYVDPYHGQIILGETGTWSYQDLGSENGSKRGKELVNDCALTSADVLTLGKTRLQFFDPSHQVAPALSLHNSRQRLLSFNTWSTSGLLLIGAILTLALNIYLNYTGEKLDAGMLMGIFLGAFSLPLIVSTAWSLLAKFCAVALTFLALLMSR